MARYEYHFALQAVRPEEATGIVDDLRRLFGKKNVAWHDGGRVTVVTSLTSEAALDAIRLFVRKHPKVSFDGGLRIEE